MGKKIINELRPMCNSILTDLGCAGDQFRINCPRPFGQCRGEGDELVNRSYRNRAADELDHRDVTSNYPGSGGSRG